MLKEKRTAQRVFSNRQTLNIVPTSSSNLMEYKGYVGRIEFDSEAGIFHGEVINLRDVITFRGKSVDELYQDLQDSVEDYLEFCKEIGEKPEKPYSGKFVVRTDPELHRMIAEKARAEGVSMNRLLNNCIRHVFVEQELEHIEELTPAD